MKNKNNDILSFIDNVVLGIKKENKNKNHNCFSNAYPIIIDSNSLVTVLNHLKSIHNISVLVDIFGSDNLKTTEYQEETFHRFNIHYLLLNIQDNFRLSLKIQISENQEIESISGIFKSACWFERELYDMYGIRINGLSDHRRILTDYEFQGFPLRKDFPLSGNYEVAYSITENQVVKRPVKLLQEFRDFDNLSKWVETKYEDIINSITTEK